MPNHHCSVAIIAGTGILIEGPPGAGKTSLTLGLIDTARARGLQARFVCDDQALLETRQSRLYAHAPLTIAGKVEIRGFGIHQLEHAASTEISLICSLCEDETVERMPAPATKALLGISIPLLRLPARHEQQAVRIVLAHLKEIGK